MASDPGIDPLLSRIEALSPQFGRARTDIDAVVVRGKNGDYRGVLQNTRLVVETLLRAILAKKKQSPGKQTLEQLVGKLQQNLPTPVMVHVRTIQAWGNVGAHDHAADLFEEGVTVTETEALAALHSFVAILTWYADTHLDGSGTSAPVARADSGRTSSPSAPLASVASTERASKLPVSLIGTAVGLAALAGGLVLFGKEDTNGRDRKIVDDFYRHAKVPLPPESCRATDPTLIAELTQVSGWLAGGKKNGRRAEDQQAVARLEATALRFGDHAEHAYFLARALQYAGRDRASIREVITRGLRACPGLAALHNIDGTLLFQEEKLDAARASFERALQQAPDYLDPRFNLGLVAFKAGDVTDALSKLDAVVHRDPEYTVAYQTRGTLRFRQDDLEGAAQDFRRWTELSPADGKAHLMLGQALKKMSQDAPAREAFCRAKALGATEAAALCP